MPYSDEQIQAARASYLINIEVIKLRELAKEAEEIILKMTGAYE